MGLSTSFSHIQMDLKKSLTRDLFLSKKSMKESKQNTRGGKNMNEEKRLNENGKRMVAWGGIE